MIDSIKVGLIGFGIGGQVFHAPVLTAINGLELTKIRARKPAEISFARSRYPQAAVVETAEEIFDDKEIDLVVIATPNSSHHSLATEALKAGKHVVVDKPFTISSADADELIGLAIQQSKILTVHHNRRWDSDFLTIRKIIQSGMLGELVELESHYDRFRNFLKPNAWREQEIPGSGILYDLGSHLIDQVLFLFGLPDAVTADIRAQRKGGKVNDNFELILHYDGIKVTLKAGMLVREPLPRFILTGSHGTYLKYGMDVQEEALKAGYTPLKKSNWGVEPHNLWGKVNTEYNGLHLVGNIESEMGNYGAFYQNVYDAIKGNASLIVTAGQARNTIRTVELAMQSNQEKRTLPWSDK